MLVLPLPLPLPLRRCRCRAASKLRGFVAPQLVSCLAFAGKPAADLLPAQQSQLFHNLACIQSVTLNQLCFGPRVLAIHFFLPCCNRSPFELQPDKPSSKAYFQEVTFNRPNQGFQKRRSQK